MTLDEYTKEYNELAIRYRETRTNEDRDALIDAQYAFMEELLEPLLDIHGTPEEKEVGAIIDYLTYRSTSGSVISYVESKEFANRVVDTLFKKVGDLMLDMPEVYQIEDGRWAVDCMFDGAFCPAWDGIDDD